MRLKNLKKAISVLCVAVIAASFTVPYVGAFTISGKLPEFYINTDADHRNEEEKFAQEVGCLNETLLDVISEIKQLAKKYRRSGSYEKASKFEEMNEYLRDLVDYDVSRESFYDIKRALDKLRDSLSIYYLSAGSRGVVNAFENLMDCLDIDFSLDDE